MGTKKIFNIFSYFILREKNLQVHEYFISLQLQASVICGVWTVVRVVRVIGEARIAAIAMEEATFECVR